MKKGVCIQIGIGFTPEYIYLTEPRWQHNVRYMHSIWQIPPVLIHDIDTWSFYGIDSDPYGMAHAMRAYQNRENVHWVLAHLSTADKPLETTLSNLGIDFHVPVTTFDNVLDHLNITQIDLLAIDIEGHELNLFETYSWRYLPKYIAVEVHGNPPIGPAGVAENVDKMLSLLFELGYKCLRKIPTNFRDDKAHTIELQLLKD